MSMLGHWFKSSMFKVEPGEDSETNPGRYGKQVSEWLKAQLEDRGYTIQDLVPKDWGRCIICSTDPFRLWVGVGNVDMDPSSEAPAPTDDIVWHCFSVAEVPFWKRIFGKVDSQPAVEKLHATLGEILANHEEITLVPEP